MDKNKLIKNYLDYLDFKKSENYDEKYKFDFFENNQIDFLDYIDDFEEKFKEIKKNSGNLVPRKLRDYLLIVLWNEARDDFIKIFKFLYDENIELSKKIDFFEKELYEAMKKTSWKNLNFAKLGFGEVSFLLALKDYKKYPFINPVVPFNNFMKEYNLDENLYKKGKNGERYENWQKLVNQILIPEFKKIDKNVSLVDIQDFIFCIYGGYKKEEKINKIELKNKEKGNMIQKNETSKLLDIKKQIILYGPPGTGKTYNIKGIIENHSGEQYDILKNDGRVEFITFHQSFSYEEFIEGIKPTLEGDSENISYKIEDGIFKKIVEKSKIKSNTNIDLKIEELKEKLIENNIKINGTNKFTLKYRGGTTFKITPENTKNPDTDYPVNIDNIKKLYFNKIKRSEIYNPTYTVGILEYLYKNGLKKYQDISDENIKNHYLVIDEINRGNISKIFGELITLLESDKRVGEKNEITTKLPYSKEIFGIPSNLFIVATMNTSDKSIVSLDTALRRRFGFIEMPPVYNLEELETNIEGINLGILLKKLNDRIEFLLDKDHLIGHSYFTKVNNLEELKFTIYNEIYPLLEEYFYSEEEKIRLVLGDNLFIKKSFNKNLFENNEEYEENEKLYGINKNLNDEDFIKAIKKIINNNEK